VFISFLVTLLQLPFLHFVSVERQRVQIFVDSAQKCHLGTIWRLSLTLVGVDIG